MNRIVILVSLLFFLNHCSFNKNIGVWKNKDEDKDSKKNITKILEDTSPIVKEFNPNFKLEFFNIKTNKKIINNKIANYKFSKFEDIVQLNYKPLFLSNEIIFFDKKGAIIRFNKKNKIFWKKNYYSKIEKRLKPKLNFILDDENLIITDNIAKYYSINLNSGKLNWSKSSVYPFNSHIKRNKNKFFVVDFKNTLRCFNINNGSECWNLKTEETFTVSNTKLSLILTKDMVIFSNSIGDITAVNIESGLIAWQLPTQSSSIIGETFNFKISKIISDGNSIYFSNNRNEFYSVNIKTGVINWIAEINSSLTPAILKNFIFTVSSKGYLYVVDKDKGNIIRITDLYKDYKPKKRNNIKPIGFVLESSNLYLTNTDGKMIIVDLNNGKIIGLENISKKLISKPFIFNQNIFIIKNGSIVQYN